MRDARRSVSVTILGHEYKIRSDSDEAFVRRVAKLVDETMARIQERTRTVDSLDLAVLAAVNLASDLLTEKRRAGDRVGHDVSTRIRALAELAERAVVDVADER